MSERGWKRVAFVLALGCVALFWRSGCGGGGGGGAAAGSDTGERASGADPASPPPPRRFSAEGRRPGAGDRRGEGAGPAPAREQAARGIEAPPPPEPHWLLKLARPRPDESLLDYRDRVLPVAQAAVAPQRRRVAENREDFVAAADLDPDQVAAIDAAVDEAAEAIAGRVLEGVYSGELWPRNLKPAEGVVFARDLLDEVVRADRRVREVLDGRQLAALEESPFDVADYLLFSVRWEEVLGIAP